MERSNVNKMIFLRAFACVIDDMGWNQGSNLSVKNLSALTDAALNETLI